MSVPLRSAKRRSQGARNRLARERRALDRAADPSLRDRMKFLPATIAEIVRTTAPTRPNVRLLWKFIAVLIGLVVAYSGIFHLLMAYEDRTHHLFDGVYWTFTVMTTLGFGDITFHSVPGRVFSVIVMLSGLVFLLMLLPFTFIEFFYAPWMAAHAAARTPRTAPPDLSGHVIFSLYDPIVATLIPRLDQYRRPYLVLVANIDEARRLLDLGVNVMHGAADDPDSWHRARAEHAALILATDSDIPNTNVVFTARGQADRTPIVATAKELPSFEILPQAGADRILRLDELLGGFLARCVAVAETRIHVVAEFGPLLIAQAAVDGTALAGHTLRDSGLREKTGLVAIGGWTRGHFQPAAADMRLTPGMLLVMAGSRLQVDAFNQAYPPPQSREGMVLVIGGGRVGRAATRALQRLGQEFRVVEKVADRSLDLTHTTVGNAAELEVMRTAGLLRARTVIITPHEDDTNIYLTVFCRRVRPDIQIITRCTHERNMDTLHRAGADFVMSYTTLAADAVLNQLAGGDVLMIAEGVNAFRVPAPPSLAGKTIAESGIRESTGCHIAGVQSGDAMHINPAADWVLRANQELILVGTIEAEARFLESHPIAATGRRDVGPMG